MTVYVDNMRMRATVGRLQARWSHLIADTEEELHEFAERLGLQRWMFQDPREDKRPPAPDSYAANTWHYDVVDTKRRQAIEMGAIAVDLFELPDLIYSRMATGKCRPEPGVVEK